MAVKLERIVKTYYENLEQGMPGQSAYMDPKHIMNILNRVRSSDVNALSAVM